MVTNAEFAVLQNEVKNMKRDINTLRTSNHDMIVEIHKMQLSVARATWITITMQSVAIGVVVWMIKGAVSG